MRYRTIPISSNRRIDTIVVVSDVRAEPVSPTVGVLDFVGTEFPGRWPGLRNRGPVARKTKADERDVKTLQQTDC